MLLIITIETYTLGKIAMTAVPMEGKDDRWIQRATLDDLVLLYLYSLDHTYGESKCPQDVDDLNAQVKVVEVLLKKSCEGRIGWVSAQRLWTARRLVFFRQLYMPEECVCVCVCVVTWACRSSHGIDNQSPTSHLNSSVIIFQQSRVNRSLRERREKQTVSIWAVRQQKQRLIL